MIMVKAVKSIEDWFLYDLENILAFLGLKKDTKITGGNGYEKLKMLYRKANKIYFKGMKSNGMISKLDIQTISVAVRTQLEPLYKALGVDL